MSDMIGVVTGKAHVSYCKFTKSHSVINLILSSFSMNLFVSGIVKNISSRLVKVRARFLGISPSLTVSGFLEIITGLFQLTL